MAQVAAGLTDKTRIPCQLGLDIPPPTRAKPPVLYLNKVAPKHSVLFMTISLHRKMQEEANHLSKEIIT